MDDLINMMVDNQSPSDISDRIKEILMQKSAENIETIRPLVAASIFGSAEEGEESEEDSVQDEEVPEEDAE